MGILWRPKGGKWSNIGPQGFGELYNSDSKTIQKGCFINGILNDPNGQLIDHCADCCIFRGPFENGIKNGEFTVYTIQQSVWEAAANMGSAPGTPAKKKTVVYSSGSEISSSPEEEILINLSNSRNSHHCIVDFNFT